MRRHGHDLVIVQCTDCVVFPSQAVRVCVLCTVQVLDISVTHDKSGRRQPAYLIHFLRWNSRFALLCLVRYYSNNIRIIIIH